MNETDPFTCPKCNGPIHVIACIEDSDIDKEQAVIDYVLSGFTRQEKKIMDSVIPEVSRAILCLLTEGIEAAMNKYN